MSYQWIGLNAVSTLTVLVHRLAYSQRLLICHAIGMTSSGTGTLRLRFSEAMKARYQNYLPGQNLLARLRFG